MFRTISGNKKLIGLVIVTMILILSSFKKSFKPTLDSYKQQIEVEEKLLLTKGALSKIKILKSEVNLLNNQVGALDRTPQEVQQQLLSFANKIPNINIVNVNEIHYAQNSLFKIYTHQIDLEGSYQDLLKGLYDFERDFNISRIVSFSFNNKKKNGVVLKNQRLNIIFQNYEKNK